MPLRARAKLACEIAGLEPQKLNEAVHFGHLPCVPETRPGSVRIFDVDQIVMLTIFAEELRTGTNTAKAGEIACAIYGELRVVTEHRSHGLTRANPHAARFYFAPREYDPAPHPSSCVALYGEDGTPILHNGSNLQALGGRMFSYAAKFNDYPVGAYRERAEHHLEHHDKNRVVGEDIDG